MCCSGWWGGDCSCIRFILAGDSLQTSSENTSSVPQTKHRQCHCDDFPETRKLWLSDLNYQLDQAVIPPVRTHCWELIRERDLCFMTLLWWSRPQKAVVYNNIFLLPPAINVLLVTNNSPAERITRHCTRDPDSGHKERREREREPPLAASVAAGSRMEESADGRVLVFWSHQHWPQCVMISPGLTHCHSVYSVIISDAVTYLAVSLAV